MKKKACSTLIVYLHFDHVFLANFQIYTTKGHYIVWAQKPYEETKPHTLNQRITAEKLARYPFLTARIPNVTGKRKS